MLNRKEPEKTSAEVAALDESVNMGAFGKGGRGNAPELPQELGGDDGGKKGGVEYITFEFMVDPAKYRGGIYQPKDKTPKTAEEVAEKEQRLPQPQSVEDEGDGNALSAIDMMIDVLKHEGDNPTPLNTHHKKWARKRS